MEVLRSDGFDLLAVELFFAHLGGEGLNYIGDDPLGDLYVMEYRGWIGFAQRRQAVCADEASTMALSGRLKMSPYE